MAKATRGTATPAATRRVVGREIVRRAQRLHADALEVISAYYDLASRYERLVTAVDVFWDDIASVDDALWDVHERLGLQAVSAALEAAAQRFEEAGLAAFAAGARAAFGAETPTLQALREQGATIGSVATRSVHQRGASR
jgi:hypothetical protein